jgi:septin family protein
MHYSIQDTPGYGDSFDVSARLRMMLKFIERGKLDYMRREKSLTTDMAYGADPRVDVCLYFIPPHRLKEIDVEFMSRLAKEVPLIPIIAKADSMTDGELHQFKQLVQKQCNDSKITYVKFKSFDPPFAVVASDRGDPLWPTREYSWGTCEALNRSHSDSALLKRLLLEDEYHDVKGASYKFYARFKALHMQKDTGGTIWFNWVWVVVIILIGMWCRNAI